MYNAKMQGPATERSAAAVDRLIASHKNQFCCSITQKKRMVTESFAKWAVGFSGCDGGNPTGIWICGIEFGQGHTEHNLKLEEDVSKPGYVGGVGWEYPEEMKQFPTYQYNRKALKLLCALAGHDVTKYREFYEAERCFHESSGYFKLNLYPLGFKDTRAARWQEWLALRTGFETKQGYKEWCQGKRFPVLREWVQKYSPKLIVCTGVTYRAEFFKAFGDGAQNPQVDNSVGKPIWYIVTNAGRTLVAVIYFLGGRKGLKSDAELSSTGKRLAGLLHRVEGGAQSAYDAVPVGIA